MAADLEQLKVQASQLAEKFRQAGQPELADLLNVDAQGFGVKARFAREKGIERFSSDSTPVETIFVAQTPELRDRQLRGALLPFIQEYQTAKVHTPELVNHTWQGIWRIVGETVNFTYEVPSCDRTIEELKQLRIDEKAALLLPDDIYTPAGLVRLGEAFPLMRSWVTDPKDVAKISHGFDRGGCIDIEMSVDAPYRISKGYNEQELKKAIAKDNRRGQRVPTYLMGSQFSKLLTGFYFDEKRTWSRLPESFSSFSDDMVVSAAFDPDGGAGVIPWNPQGQRPHLGGRSEGAKRA